MNYILKKIFILSLCLIPFYYEAMEVYQNGSHLVGEQTNHARSQELLDFFLKYYEIYARRSGDHSFFKILTTGLPSDGDDLINLKIQWQDLKKKCTWSDSKTLLTAALMCCHGNIGAKFASHLAQYKENFRTKVGLGKNFGTCTGVLQIFADPNSSLWDDENFTKFLKIYCKKNLRIGNKNEEGRLPLHVIARYRTLADVKLACREGLWAKKPDDHGFTPIDYASINPHYRQVGNNPIVEYLEKRAQEE